jgi:hypothetical protein
MPHVQRALVAGTWALAAVAFLNGCVALPPESESLPELEVGGPASSLDSAAREPTLVVEQQTGLEFSVLNHQPAVGHRQPVNVQTAFNQLGPASGLYILSLNGGDHSVSKSGVEGFFPSGKIGAELWGFEDCEDPLFVGMSNCKTARSNLGSRIELDSEFGFDLHEARSGLAPGSRLFVSYPIESCASRPDLCDGDASFDSLWADCRVIEFDEEGRLTFDWLASTALSGEAVNWELWSSGFGGPKLSGIFNTSGSAVYDPFHCNSAAPLPGNRGYIV